MKKLLLLIILIVVALFGTNHYLSRDGKGGQDALVNSLEGKRPLALVTGATGGIGRELSKAMDAKGYRLILHGRSQEKLNELASQLRTKPEMIVADFTKPEDRQKVIETINQLKPALVINNAGYILRGKVLEHDNNDAQTAIDVNCTALTEFTIAAVKSMRANNQAGIVLNVSSVAGQISPYPGFSIYSATKAYASDFSIAFDYELRNTPIRVLTFQPGYIPTKPYADKSHGRVIGIHDAVNGILQQIDQRETSVTYHYFYRIMVWLKALFPKNVTLQVLSARH